MDSVTVLHPRDRSLRHCKYLVERLAGTPVMEDSPPPSRAQSPGSRLSPPTISPHLLNMQSFGRRQSLATILNHETTKAMMKWEKEKQELKSRLSELDDYKNKYEAELEENQELQNKLDLLQAGQSNTSARLAETSELADKLRQENKVKVDRMEKIQRDLSFKDDRIRNLEIRASEVEKAELILETTKQNLEMANQQVRVREGEIRRISKDAEDLTRQLEVAKETNKDLEEKTDDLKLQVRHELKKNDGIEKNLEMIPRLRDTIHDRDVEIQKLQKQLDEKTALLSSARRAVGEYKDKLRMAESELSVTASLREELHHSQCEVLTLKKLVSGKDYLVVQKSKALDLSKEVIQTLNDPAERERVERLQQLIERVGSSQLHGPTNCRDGPVTHCDHEFRSESAPPPRRGTTPTQEHSKELTVDSHPYTAENGHHDSPDGNNNKQFLNRVITDMPNRKRPISAMGQTKKTSPIHKTTSLKEATKVYRMALPRKQLSDKDNPASPRRTNSYRSEVKVNSKFNPSLDYRIGFSDKTVTMDNNTETVSPRGQSPWAFRRKHSLSDSDSTSDASDLEEEVTPEQESSLRQLSAKERDTILSGIVAVGDRVLLTIPQKPLQYGKNKAVKPLIHTGIVKYKGKLDPDKRDARLHIGVRLDDPVGDTDGTFRNKRLMFTPLDQGKFFKIREVTSVLNIKTGRYVPVKKMMYRQQQKARSA